MWVAKSSKRLHVLLCRKHPHQMSCNSVTGDSYAVGHQPIGEIPVASKQGDSEEGRANANIFRLHSTLFPVLFPALSPTQVPTLLPVRFQWFTDIVFDGANFSGDAFDF